jgi:Fe2+ or Zn2+ uptake regulation protein
MGYCKHEWQARSEQLRAVFNGAERTTHEFLVCRRCLKIRELEADAKVKPGVDEESGVNAA